MLTSRISIGDDAAILLDHIAKHRKEMHGLRNQSGVQWNQEGWLFVNLEGEPLSPRGLNKRFSGLLKRANLHLKGYGIHTMRHAHISELPTSNI